VLLLPWLLVLVGWRGGERALLVLVVVVVVVV
jgi:hypothetical protein